MAGRWWDEILTYSPAFMNSRGQKRGLSQNARSKEFSDRMNRIDRIRRHF